MLLLAVDPGVRHLGWVVVDTAKPIGEDIVDTGTEDCTRGARVKDTEDLEIWKAVGELCQRLLFCYDIEAVAVENQYLNPKVTVSKLLVSIEAIIVGCACSRFKQVFVVYPATVKKLLQNEVANYEGKNRQYTNKKVAAIELAKQLLGEHSTKLLGRKHDVADAYIIAYYVRCNEL